MAHTSRGGSATRLAICAAVLYALLPLSLGGTTGLGITEPVAADYTRGRPLDIKISVDVRLLVDLELFRVKEDGSEVYVVLEPPLPQQRGVGPGVATIQWLIPATFEPGSYYVRARIAGDTVNNYRSATFQVIIPTITVPLPPSAGGASVLYTGTAYLVPYSVKGDLSQGIFVDACPEGTTSASASCPYPVWSGGVPGNNAFSWLVPKAMASPGGAKYVLRLVSSIDPAAVAFSPAFTVAVGSVEASLSDSKGGAVATLRALGGYSVSWTCTSAYNTRVTYSFGSTTGTIREEGGQSGSAAFVVPFAAQGVPSFVVRVAAYQPSQPDAPAFTAQLQYAVQAARVEWTSPASGAALAVGERRELAWSSTADVPRWDIVLRSADGTSFMPVASGVPGPSFSWLLPASVPIIASATLSIRGTDTEHMAVSATLAVSTVPGGGGGVNMLAIIVGCSVGGFVLLCLVVVLVLWWIARTFVDDGDEDEEAAAPGNAPEYKHAGSRLAAWFTIGRGSKTNKSLQGLGRSLRRFGFGGKSGKAPRASKTAKVVPGGEAGAAGPARKAEDDGEGIGGKSVRFGARGGPQAPAPAVPTTPAALPSLMQPMAAHPTVVMPAFSTAISIPAPAVRPDSTADALKLLPVSNSMG
eukprot:tig00000796_g4241.t1